jgi:hypothetical protein
MIKQTTLLLCLLILCNNATEDSVTYIDFNFGSSTGFEYDNEYTMNILRGSVDAKQLDFTVRCPKKINDFYYLFSDELYDNETTTILSKLTIVAHRVEHYDDYYKFTFSAINSKDIKYKYFYLGVKIDPTPTDITILMISSSTPSPSPSPDSPSSDSSGGISIVGIILIVVFSVIGLCGLCICIVVAKDKGCAAGCDECCKVVGDCCKCVEACCRICEACAK